ncbi:cation channel sperm-associated auxiliary subunit TMEM262 [Eublepharis macularius]|uniref:Cation channel sperm-associated auxiliary subunit TMEM262 n=1 Tax=Eublepharis macularius TaxID=481883 RepID=A0AA97KS55_EUBMA|nr:cation channel sperm-associated auxiliary subunit TMEM262 [Eublepharis macularius]
MSWKDPFVTVTFPSKVVLTIASILLLIIHTGVIIGDLYHFLGSQRVDLMSFHFTITLLFSQVASFYWALLATIYTLQAEDSVLMCFALTSLALNFAVFIVRFVMEFFTIAYREERYE